MSDWLLNEVGLWDGDVPIVWAAIANVDGGLVPMLGVFADYEDILANIPSLLAERDDLRQQLATVTAQRDAAVEILRDVEHIIIPPLETPNGPEFYKRCPKCMCTEEHGHTKQCKLDAALRKARE